MKRLLTYMRPYWPVIAVSLFLLLIDSLLQIIGPLLTKLAVDRYLAPATNGARALSFLSRWLAADAWTGLSQL
ncbi:MAG: ABC transporter ATP-binding protein, partial [Acidobacteriaceae bacterium]|nr:ABC transporter ATP-binding protein [Acidobacteriaceae bacterium]